MVDGQRFEPASLSVQMGTTVRWVSEAEDPHTVTAYADSLPEDAEYFSSGGAPGEEEARADVAEGLIREGDTYEVTLNAPGTYRYFCIPHEAQGMTGTITVTE